MSKPETFSNVALSAQALKNIEKLAWPRGCVLRCGVCLIEKRKTPEEMRKYLTRWPSHCGHSVDVRPL